MSNVSLNKHDSSQPETSNKQDVLKSNEQKRTEQKRIDQQHNQHKLNEQKNMDQNRKDQNHMDQKRKDHNAQPQLEKTADLNKAASKQKTPSVNINTGSAENKNQTPDTTTPNTTKRSSDTNAKTNSKKESQPKFAAVDTIIAGKVYTINCPQGEENELGNASNEINEFINGIRQQAPNLSHENLLVLCCLNLHEQLQQAKKDSQTQQNLNHRASEMIDKIMTDLTDLT